MGRGLGESEIGEALGSGHVPAPGLLTSLDRAPSILHRSSDIATHEQAFLFDSLLSVAFW
jgi:hypothetical protein